MRISDWSSDVCSSDLTDLLALDAHPGIDIRVYNPFRNRSGPLRVLELVQRFFSVNHRMHNKAWIADGRVAVLGGRNIGQEYFDASTDTNFRDLDVVLFGPKVVQASAIFDAFWNSEAALPISALSKASPEQLANAVERKDGVEGKGGVRRCVRGGSHDDKKKK